MRHTKANHILVLLTCLGLVLSQSSATLSQVTASVPDSIQRDDGYTPTGIPAHSLPSRLPLQNINLRFTPPGPAEMGPYIRQALSAARATSASDVGATLAVPDEVQVLADGLEGDPLRIYEYVHNHVDFVSTWGLFKNSRETLLSGYGNPFDQAELLAALLQAAGYTTRYAFGAIQISKSQAMNWTGVTGSSVVAYAFANGGISTTDTGSNLEIEHVWVEVDIGGLWYPLDPSFKSYTYQSKLDLASILGYNQTAFLDAANGTGDSIYVQNLDDEEIRDRLTDYSNSLLAYLETNAPFAYPEDVIGGREIVPETSSALPTALPYTVVTDHGSADTFSNDFKHLLRVQLAGIDYQVPLADVAGERVTIFYEGTTSTDRNTIANAGGIYNVYPAYQINMTPHLRIDGTTVASGNGRKLGSPETIEVTMTTPIPDGQGGYQSYSFSQQVTTGAWYALPIRAQGVSLATLNRHYNLLRENMELESDAEAHLGQALYVLGMSYFNQVDFAGKLDAQIGGIVEIPLFSVMLMSQGLSTEWEYISDDWEVVRVGMASYTIDVQMNLGSLVSASGDESMEIAYMFSSGIKGSAAEHATIEQLQSASAVSTIRALALANAEGQKIYNITSASQLGALDHSQVRLLSLSDDLSTGYRLLIPMTNIVQRVWNGAGWIAYDPASGSAGYLISGNLGGGQGSLPGLVDSNQMKDNAPVSDISLAHGSHVVWVFDPVDVSSGAFQQQETGLILDSTQTFAPAYYSDRSHLDSPLGYGWTHSYEYNLQPGSDWARGMGAGTAAAAAASIAASYVCLDILDATPGSLPFERLLIASIGADWAMDQLTDNSVLVQGPWGTAQYLMLSDNRYAPSAGFDRTLARLANGGYTLQAKDGSTIHFTGRGQAAALADANDNQTMLSYDSMSRLRRAAGPTGRGFHFFYDDDHVSQVIDSAGRVLRFAYDAQDDLISYTNARGGITTYTYDDQHRLLTVTDPEGVVAVDNTYNSLGQVTQQENGRGLMAYLLYGGDRTTLIDPAGRRTIYFYDTRGRLVGAEDDLGYRTAATYDAHDNLLSYTDTNSHTLTFTYDALANLTSIANVSGTITLDYDDDDNLLQATDARNNVTHFAYDDKHNLTLITNAQNYTTSLAYDAQGQLIALTDADGFQTDYAYDPHGHLIGVVGLLDDETRMYYDSAGRLVSLTDAYSQTIYLAYDANDNLTTVTNTLGYAFNYAYDGNDNLTQVTSPRGAATRLGYDGQFNLVVVTDTLGYATIYTYDASDYLVNIQDANDHATAYQRDALGRVTVITDSLSRVTRFTYDGEGNLLTLLKASGDVITYTYDALDRLTGIVYPDDTAANYAYDAVGNLTAADYGTWQAQYQYDELDRFDEVAYPALTRTVAYNYDSLGHTQAITVTEDTGALYQVQYLYDEAGRLAYLVDSLNGATISTTHDLLGNLTTIAYANGATTDYVYDSEGQALHVETRTPVDGVIDRISYSYDPDGNPTQVADMMDAGSDIFTHTYTYDLARRLTGESYTGYSATYGYDAVGNLVHYADVSGTMTYTYDAANQLLSANDVTYSYDANGNRTGKVDAGDVYTYQYDYADRLIDWSGPTDSWQFTYDATGRRSGIRGPDGASGFLFNGMQLILEDWQPDVGAPWQAAFLHAGGRLVARQGGPGDVSFHGDVLGNVRHLVDGAGAVTDAYRYRPYGLPVMVSGTDVNPYRFVGQWGVRVEAFENSLYWMGFRVYDAGSGRFLTHDPLPGLLDQPYSQNPYLYANASPTCYIDYCGLRPAEERKAHPPDRPATTIEHPADGPQQIVSQARQGVGQMESASQSSSQSNTPPLVLPAAGEENSRTCQ